MVESLIRDHPAQGGRAGLLHRLPLWEGAHILRGVAGKRLFEMVGVAELGIWI